MKPWTRADIETEPFLGEQRAQVLALLERAEAAERERDALRNARGGEADELQLDRDWYRRQRDDALKLAHDRGVSLGEMARERDDARAEASRLAHGENMLREQLTATIAHRDRLARVLERYMRDPSANDGDDTGECITRGLAFEQMCKVCQARVVLREVHP